MLGELCRIEDKNNVFRGDQKIPFFEVDSDHRETAQHKQGRGDKYQRQKTRL